MWADYWGGGGGGKEYVGPPLKLFGGGGAGPSPCPPLPTPMLEGCYVRFKVHIVHTHDLGIPAPTRSFKVILVDNSVSQKFCEILKSNLLVLSPLLRGHLS